MAAAVDAAVDEAAAAVEATSLNDEDEGPSGPDPRIAKLQAYMADHSPAEVAAMVQTDEYSKGNIVINDTLCMNKQGVASYILVMAVFGTDVDAFTANPMSKQVKANKALLKAYANETPKNRIPLLGAMEAAMLASEEARVAEGTRKNNEVFQVMCELFNADVMGDEEEEATAVYMDWEEKQNISKEFGLEEEAAEKVRELSQPFFDWLEQGEESDEEITISY